MLWIKIIYGTKISFGEIECSEMDMDSHLGISIGTDTIFGGTGQQDIRLTMVGILGTIGDGTETHSIIDQVGTMDMDSTIGIGEIEWTIMLGNIEIEEMLFM